MITLKRYYLFLFFIFWLLAFQHRPAFSQQASTSSETNLGNQEKILESKEQSLQPNVTPEVIEEYLSLPAARYFLPSLSKVILPGHVKLDDSTLDLIYGAQLDSGVKNFTTFSILLINESQKATERGEIKEAIRLAKAAKKFAPDFPQPYWALTKAYEAENKINFYRVFKESLRGYLIGLKNFRYLFIFTTNIYLILLLALFLTIIILSLVLLGKYFSLLTYDIGEFLSQKTSYAFPSYLWAGFIIILPIIYGFSPLLVACYWLIILAVYVTKKEKRVIWVIFLLLILLPWILGNAASMILANQPDIIDSLHRANYEDWSPENEQMLKAWLKNHPQDSSVIFTLGLINKKQGKYDEAESYYKNVLEMNPEDGNAIGNLANVYLAKGQLEKAEETYKKAIELNKESASFHYNLYRTYIERYKFLEASGKEELSIARKLAPDLIEYQEKIYRPDNNNRMLLDEPLTLEQFWNKVFISSKKREMLASSLWRLFLKGIPYRYGIFVFILLALLFSFLSFQDTQRKFSTRCNKCGKLMKRRIRLRESAKFPKICSHCVNIFIQKNKIDQKVKDKKIDQVEKHQKRQNIIWKSLTYVLPGGGHLWIGFTGIGMFYLFIFFCFILKIIFWNGIVRDPLALSVSISFPKILLFILLFVGINFLITRNSYRKKEHSDDAYIQLFEALHGKAREEKSKSEKVEISTKKD